MISIVKTNTLQAYESMVFKMNILSAFDNTTYILVTEVQSADTIYQLKNHQQQSTVLSTQNIDPYYVRHVNVLCNLST